MAAFSSGNHAQAVALASREAGVRAVIAMPEDAPKAKVAATQAYGAEIVFMIVSSRTAKKWRLRLLNETGA